MAYSAVRVLWNRIQIIEQSRPKTHTTTNTHTRTHSDTHSHTRTVILLTERTSENAEQIEKNKKKKKQLKQEPEKSQIDRRKNKQTRTHYTHMKCLRSTNSREENILFVYERQTTKKWNDFIIMHKCNLFTFVYNVYMHTIKISIRHRALENRGKNCECCKNVNTIRQPVELLSLWSSYVVNTIKQCMHACMHAGRQACTYCVQFRIGCCILYFTRVFVRM